MTYINMLNKAIEMAIKAHNGQVDKGGNPYIFHPLRVMLSRQNEKEQICGVLHDVVEDTPITLDELAQEGFSKDIIDTLNCLTRREGENYDEYIDRVITNKIASNVKLADLCDNMDLTRIKNPTAADKERVKKYNKAAYKISKALLNEDTSNFQIDTRTIKIDGCVEIQSYLTCDDFLNCFIRFVESHGWLFGGGIDEVTDKMND